MNLRIFLLPAAALSLAACHRHVDPEFVRVEADTLLSRGDCSIEVGYSFESIANASKSPALGAIEQANIGYFFGMEEFDGTVREAVERSLRELDETVLSEAEAYGCDRELWLSTSSNVERCDSMLVCGIHTESYMGGAHGMSGTYYHVYSLESGCELTLEELFDAPTLERMRGALVARLLETNGASEVGELEEHGFFPSQIDLTENFAPTSSGGLLLRYNPYDIACYARGPVEVRFSREELEALAGR